MKNLGNINEIIKLCETHQVASLYVFGSVLSEKFNAESDIDFLVNFKEINLSDYADNYFNLKFSLEDLLKRNVDLLEEKALKNPYFIESVNTQKELIYG